MNRAIAKWVLALLMWGLGTFCILHLGRHSGYEQWNIIGNIWIVGGMLMAWLPTTEGGQ